MEIQFLGYKPTPGEKHLGIAAIRLSGLIDLRYRIIEGKDGQGFYPVVASYKVNEYGQDVYQPAFMIDSRSLHETILNCIKEGVKKAMQSKEYKHSASIAEELDGASFGDLPF